MSHKAEFAALGISKFAGVATTTDELGAFKQATGWSDSDPFYNDEAESFKKALGGAEYKNWWLAKPSVVRMLFNSKAVGHSEADLAGSSKLLGGVLVVSPSGGVIFAEQETSTFEYPATSVVLAACRSELKESQ